MKKRLDLYLVDANYYQTRNKAKLAIENGDILVDDKIITKVSYLVDETNKIKILKESIPYVSRGGLKLSKALETFKIDVNDCVCLDIGASTGGFSDCLIKNGAKKVYALDVGTNQLDASLKNNDKIVSFENTNFREIDINTYKDYKIQIITCDVSFISLSYIFENVSKILAKNGYFIALIKPQFETQKKDHNKNGVVNDKKIHLKVITSLIETANKYNLYCNKLSYSPIRGEKSGNIEYLSLFSFVNKNINLLDVSAIIELAFNELR
jgi:23S rRNA (cytidine1920-2'-O)/16S rRNA (cytidine1409-2'-O)-methyltransferase